MGDDAADHLRICRQSRDLAGRAQALEGPNMEAMIRAECAISRAELARAEAREVILETEHLRAARGFIRR